MHHFRSPVLLILLGAMLPLAAAGAPATGGTEDRAAAESVLRTLQSKSSAHRLTAQAIGECQRALERADGMRAAGDTVHAALADTLAREWAELGQSLIRATELEEQVRSIQSRIAQTETKTLRARALIEETVARKHRATSKLQELTRKPAAPRIPPK